MARGDLEVIDDGQADVSAAPNPAQAGARVHGADGDQERSCRAGPSPAEGAPRPDGVGREEVYPDQVHDALAEALVGVVCGGSPVSAPWGGELGTAGAGDDERQVTPAGDARRGSSCVRERVGVVGGRAGATGDGLFDGPGHRDTTIGRGTACRALSPNAPDVTNCPYPSRAQRAAPLRDWVTVHGLPRSGGSPADPIAGPLRAMPSHGDRLLEGGSSRGGRTTGMARRSMVPRG